MTGGRPAGLALLGAALLLALAGLLRLASVTDRPGWYTDEGTQLEIAGNWRAGEARYFALRGSTLLVARLPAFPGLLAAAENVFGAGMQTLRALTGTLGILTVAALLAGLSYGQHRWAGASDSLPWLAAGALALYPAAVLYSRLGFSYNLLAPLSVMLVLALWRYAETRRRAWLALAALIAGLGLVSDLWAGALVAPLVVVAVWRRPTEVLWALPLAALPFALYAAASFAAAPADFLFDARFTLLRLSALPLAEQPGVLADNILHIAQADPLFLIGGLGLLTLRPAGLRAAAAATFALPLLLLGRAVALYSLSAYYLIPLYPLAALGGAALVVQGWAWTARWRPARAAWAVVSLLAAIIAAGVTLTQIRDGFTTPIDDFLVAPAEARAAAAFVNARISETEVVLASPAVGWLLAGRPADFQMAAAAAGLAAPHLPADIPAARWAYVPRWETARYVIVDNLWRNWAAVHVPEVDARLRAMDNGRLVFQAGAVSVYQNLDK